MSAWPSYLAGVSSGVLLTWLALAAVGRGAPAGMFVTGMLFGALGVALAFLVAAGVPEWAGIRACLAVLP